MIQLKINNMDHKAILTVPADYERVLLALWTIGLDRDPEKYTLRQLDAEFIYTTEEESQMVRLIDPRSSLMNALCFLSEMVYPPYPVAELLFGVSTPEGRLSMSFPHSIAQAPLYYNHLPVGRPNPKNKMFGFVNGYNDCSCFARYPFGYGLSYTQFEYSPVVLSADTMDSAGCIEASVTVTNTGNRPGTETVQLYLRDVAASVSRPVRMLKGFQKITLLPGQSQKVTFEIREEMLRFYDIHMNYTSEPGLLEVHIAANSAVDNKATFLLMK